MFLKLGRGLLGVSGGLGDLLFVFFFELHEFPHSLLDVGDVVLDALVPFFVLSLRRLQRRQDFRNVLFDLSFRVPKVASRLVDLRLQRRQVFVVGRGIFELGLLVGLFVRQFGGLLRDLFVVVPLQLLHLLVHVVYKLGKFLRRRLRRAQVPLKLLLLGGDEGVERVPRVSGGARGVIHKTLGRRHGVRRGRRIERHGQGLPRGLVPPIVERALPRAHLVAARQINFPDARQDLVLPSAGAAVAPQKGAFLRGRLGLEEARRVDLVEVHQTIEGAVVRDF
mmetsp:Transcript_9182/g.29787  ORF Transcript_9182/g.29787 Transcript_9182/m.29787 type:complete len:280 (-) Transcript_9182:2070-2909(-)